MLDWRGSGTVLVVDDEDHVRNVTEMMLAQFGLTVIGACDGLEAVEVIEQQGERIQLVVMDMTMPRMDGEQAFEAMRKIRPGIKVVLTSGYSEADAIGDVGSKGVFGFLQKPFDLEKLIRTVRSAVE